MKKNLSIVLAVVLTLTLLLTSVTFAGGGKKDVNLAQEAGQAWLDSTVELTDEPPEWTGASLAAPEVCYGLDGRPSAYMFAMESDGEVVGYTIVGSSDYGYPVFEAADCPPPSIPSANEVKSTLERDLGLKVAKIGTPTRLLYLGWDHLFAVYQAGRQEVAVNLVFDFAIPAAGLTAAMPSPEEYKAKKKATGEAISELLESSGYSSLSLPDSGSNSLPMGYYQGCGSGGQGHRWNACGPCSGVSIGRYYRVYKGYGNLPGDNTMYDCLYDSMGVDSNGNIWPWNHGPGFVEMTEDCGGYYGDFNYDNVWPPTHGDYEDIVSWIDSGWPIALCGWQFDEDVFGTPGWPPGKGHCIAIKGYYYWQGTPQYLIRCTDSYLPANNLYLDWDNMTIWLPPWVCLIYE